MLVDNFAYARTFAASTSKRVAAAATISPSANPGIWFVARHKENVNLPKDRSWDVGTSRKFLTLFWKDDSRQVTELGSMGANLDGSNLERGNDCSSIAEKTHVGNAANEPNMINSDIASPVRCGDADPTTIHSRIYRAFESWIHLASA